jgi:hypothetical protein
MKSIGFPILTPVLIIGGKCLRLKTEEIVKWVSFDGKIQICEIRLPNGRTAEIHRRDTETPLPNEELEFERLERLRQNSQG